MGQYCETKTIYLLTGHGEKHLSELKTEPNYIAKNLYEAALWITKNIK